MSIKANGIFLKGLLPSLKSWERIKQAVANILKANVQDNAASPHIVLKQMALKYVDKKKNVIKKKTET